MSKELIDMIMQADDMELSETLQAIIRRYGAVHPDWEIMFLSIPKARPERRQCIAQTIEFLKSLP